MIRPLAVFFALAVFAHAHIDQLIPNQTTAGAGTFTLRAIGQEFVASEYLVFNGVRLETSFISEGELRATVPASLLRDPGTFYIVLGGSGGGGYYEYNNTAVNPPKAFTVNPPLSIVTSSPLPNATAGAAYTQTLTRAGGTAPFEWTLAAGSLPAGLTLDRATGGIRGNTAASASGASRFTVRVADAPGTFATKEFVIVTGAGGTPGVPGCEISPRNTMLAIHKADFHRTGNKIYPDHSLWVTVASGNGPATGVIVSLSASRAIFPDASGLPATSQITASTDSAGAAQFIYNPPSSLVSDTTTLAATVRVGSAVVTCRGTIVVGAGTLSALSGALESPQMAAVERLKRQLDWDTEKFSEEVQSMVFADEKLAKSMEKLQPFMEDLIDLLNDGRARLSGKEVRQAEELLRLIEKRASPDLRRALFAWREEIFALHPNVRMKRSPSWTPMPAAAAQPADARAAALRAANQPVSFEPNRGQAGAEVRYLVRGAWGGAALTRDGVTMRVGGGPQVRLRMAGARALNQAAALEPINTRTHYLHGRDSRTWLTDIEHFARVRYDNVYPRTSLVFYGDEGNLRYDFILNPGADPARIALQFDGASEAEPRPNGELLLHYRTGSATLGKPFAYQVRGKQRVEVASRYVPRANGAIGFEVGDYDRRLPLVIDPILAYSTYSGGSGEDSALAIAVDAQGNSYVAGLTTSANFAPGRAAIAGQTPPGLDNVQAFVTKFNADGSGIAYTTYFGGSGRDIASGIAVDATGAAYVCGSTTSTNFPVVQGAQAAFGGAAMAGGDGFVLKLNPAGSAIVYSTYLGGAGSDTAKAIAIDAQGNAYIAGYTSSTNFPTRNPFQPAFAGGHALGMDAFAAKLNAAGSALVYSTYLGGTSDDLAMGIAVDASGSAFLTGTTHSAGFPVRNAIQPALGGGADAFLAKLDPAGASLNYSTFIGGESDDFGLAVALGPSGDAYIAGATGSLRFPVAGAAVAQGKPGGGADALGFDAFVTRIAASGGQLVYSTFLGGSGIDIAQGIAVAQDGAAFVTGETDSQDFPVSAQLRPAGGRNDAFLTRLSPSGNAFEHSSYLGGEALDTAAAVALDRSGNAYVAGTSSSRDYPVTTGAGQTLMGGRMDAFALKVAPGTTPAQLRVLPAPARISSGAIAPSSIAAAFGAALAPRTAVAEGASLPLALADVGITIRDSRGQTHSAPLYFVSAGQVNFLVPAETARGLAQVTLLRNGQPAAEATVRVDPVAPAVFTADSSGAGAPAGFAIVVSRAGTQSQQPLFSCTATPLACEAAPLNVSSNGVYLQLYGSGIRNRGSVDSVRLTVDGVAVPVLFAAAQPEFPGLDQVNAGPLPASLAGKGQVEARLIVDGEPANVVLIRIE